LSEAAPRPEAPTPDAGWEPEPKPKVESVSEPESESASPASTTTSPVPDDTVQRQRRRRRLRSLAVGLVAAGVLAFVLFGVIGTGSGSQSGQVVPIGSVAPSFVLPSLTGGPAVNLDALGPDRHRPVVLNFFASWCVPCRQETPLLASVARSEGRKHSPVQFIGVDVGDIPSDATAFVQQAGVTYPVGVDADLRVTSGDYGLNAEPQTFFLDTTGHVVAHKLGALDRSELEQDLDAISSTS
jgi:cytochrome c biogenesis protein CcmG, thiol:disulfide interchange protein DsbE